MVELKAQKVLLADFDKVWDLLQAGSAFLKEQGVPQWQVGDLKRDSIQSDIEAGRAYFWLDGGQRVGFCILADDDPFYSQLKNWQAGEPYWAVHKFAVSPDARGRGYGLAMFEAIARLARQEKVESLRVDTHQDNARMRHLIQKAGFHFVGTVTIADGTKRLAYERRA